MAGIRYMVTDVERAIAFYTKHLGFTLDQQVGTAIAAVSSGDISLWLSGPESSAARPLRDGRRPEPGGWNRLLVEVADLDAQIDRLKRSGAGLRGEVVSGPGGRKVLVEDPDGNLVELFEPASEPRENRRTTTSPAEDRIVHASVFLPVPPLEAFEFFAEGERLEAWLAPLARVEPQVGGAYELFWDPDDPENDSTIGCRVTGIAPGGFIAFHWRGPRQFKTLTNKADPLTHVVVVFQSEGTGSYVHLVHSGWRGDPDWEEARRWQERAWSGAFEQLKRVATG